MTSQFVFASFAWSDLALDLSLKSLLILTVASATALALKVARSSAAARHFVWSLAIIGLLLLPALTAIMPAHDIPLSWNPLTQSAGMMGETTQVIPEDQLILAWSSSDAAKGLEIQNSVASEHNSLTRAEPANASSGFIQSLTSLNTRNLVGWTFACWLTGFVLALTPFCLGIASLRSLLLRSAVVKSGPLYELLQQASRRIGLRRSPQLFVSEARDMPMTWGFLRSTILLPEAANQWSSERVRVVLMHELAHVRRRDCLMQALAQGARAMYWFNPLVWLAERCIRIEQEQACDDEVLGQGFRPSEYAEHLLAILAQHRRPRFATAIGLAMARNTKLERRLQSILHSPGNHSSLSVRRMVSAVACAAALLVAISVLQLRTANAAEANQAAEKKSATKPLAADEFKAWAELRAKIADQYVGEVDAKNMEQAVIKGMLQSLGDPHSDFLTVDMIADMEKQIGGTIVGIGVHLDMHEQQIRVVTPLPDSPAVEAGIQPDDRIVQIDGQPTEKLALGDVVKRIAGREGTVVRLKIRRDGTEKDIEVKRGSVKLATVKGFRRGANNRWSYLLGSSPKIGYIQFTQFGSQTVRELRETLESLKSQTVEGLILDLRFCPGGLLDAAVDSAKQFLSSGTIVSLHSRSGKPITIKADAPATFGDVPLVVLVNEQTASAAEVVAGALQDNQRAIVVGTRTVGKGSVQTLIKLSSSSGGIRLTTSNYQLPSGRNIERRPNEWTWGVTANEGFFVPLDGAQTKTLSDRRLARDIIRPMTNSENAETEITPAWLEQQAADPQLAAALKTLTERIKSGNFTKVSDTTTAQVEQFVKRQAIEEQRAQVLKTLEKFDRELAELGKKDK